MIEVDVRRAMDSFAIDARFVSESGGITALFGRSGAGKTSVVNMLAGLVKPERGYIKVNGQVLFDSTAGINMAPETRRLGYVFQEARLFPHLSVLGNLEYGMKRAPDGERRIGLDQVTDVLGIEALLERRPHHLSGGERQRVALGRALLASPQLLLMDEPLAFLDAPRKAEILPLIERLRDGFEIPMVYVSHAMDEIIRLADTLVLMSEGAIAAVGTVEDLTSRLDLRPLTGRYEAGSVIAARVVDHDREFKLTHLSFPGGTLTVPELDAAPGREVRLRIRARDVSLSLNKPEGLSIQNVLPGTVMEIGAELGDHQFADLDIRLDVGVPLWVRISRKAVDELGITPGMNLFALIKGTSIDRQSQMGRRTGS